MNKIVLFSIFSCILLVLMPMVSSIENNLVKENFKEKYDIISKNLLLNRPILLIFLIYYIYVYLSLFFDNYYFVWIMPIPKIFSFMIYVVLLITYTFWTILIDIFPSLLYLIWPP